MLNATPAFESERVEVFVHEHYGIDAVARSLASERDQNFLLETGSQKFVLKISNGLEDVAFLEAQNQALQHLENRISFCPHVVTTSLGEPMTQIASASQQHYVRVVTYLPGKPLASLGEQSQELLFDFGRKLGQVDSALAEFDHPALHREFHWELAGGVEVIRRHGELIREMKFRSIVEGYGEQFESAVTPSLKKLRRSVIHGDANDYNVLVSDDCQLSPQIVGLIDFGDMGHSYTVADLAIALAYTMLGKSDPIDAGTHVVCGYNVEYTLSDVELETLFSLAKLRLCMSVCLAAYQQLQRPENSYLDISQNQIRAQLPALMEMNDAEVVAKFRKAMARATMEF